MSQLFVSHSGKDEKYKALFNAAFSSSGVKGVFEEYESLVSGRVTAQKISRDIAASDGVFIVLSENVQNIPHTRDWILWEAGVAQRKPIWVFEPNEQMGKVTVLVPQLTHHIVFGVNEAWLGYIKRIIESYDTSKMLPGALSGAAVLGFLINPIFGLVGAAGGTLIMNKSYLRPTGTQITCCRCSAKYSVHLPKGVMDTRCPVCNSMLRVVIQQRGMIRGQNNPSLDINRA